MRVAVTGATGGLGQSLVAALRARGDDVRALVRRTSPTEGMYRLGVTMVEGDIADRAALRRLCEGSEAVVHLAARTQDHGPEDEIARVNIQGTATALEAAHEAGVGRFVHLSTTAVYGDVRVATLDESLPLQRCGRPSADSKLAAERRVFAYGAETGLPVAVVRPCRTYGPHDRTFLPRWTELLRARRFVYVVDPSTRINLVHASHVVDVILRAMEQPGAVGEAFQVSDGAPVTLGAAVETLCRCLRVPPPTAQVPESVARAGGAALERVIRFAGRPAPAWFTPSSVEALGAGGEVSVAKARRVLGFVPVFGTLEGLEQVAV